MHKHLARNFVVLGQKAASHTLSQKSALQWKLSKLVL